MGSGGKALVSSPVVAFLRLLAGIWTGHGAAGTQTGAGIAAVGFVGYVTMLVPSDCPGLSPGSACNSCFPLT